MPRRIQAIGLRGSLRVHSLAVSTTTFQLAAAIRSSTRDSRLGSVAPAPAGAASIAGRGLAAGAATGAVAGAGRAAADVGAGSGVLRNAKMATVTITTINAPPTAAYSHGVRCRSATLALGAVDAGEA